MRIEDIKENLEKRFDFFENKNITLETPIKEKIKIVEENRYKKALIKINYIPDRYLLGKIEPKNGIFFGLRVINPQIESNYCETLPYENLSELILCSD